MDSFAESQELRDRLVGWRRDFHRHPELAFQERRTAAIVAEHLQRLGYRVKTGIGETGVVGLMDGSGPGPVLMLRFDMDALPVQEETGAPYVSLVPGCMHACGHDAHVAIGMGVAELLVEHREDWKGTIKLVFQPGEEGAGGAERMVAEGVLDDPRPDAFLACHVWLQKPVGTIDVCAGPVMSAAEKFTCRVRGQGGHGALPQRAVDPIVAAAQMISAVQTVVSRNVDPLDTAVLSFGSVHGGDACNVIPAEVVLTGTIRTFLPETREMVLLRTRELLDGVGKACGANVELDITPLTPAVINDARLSDQVRQAAIQVLGPEKVTADVRTMGSEDAAIFMQRVPGCFLFVGAANTDRGIIAAHHSPRFDLDEDCLPIAVAVMVAAGLMALQ